MPLLVAAITSKSAHCRHRARYRSRRGAGTLAEKEKTSAARDREELAWCFEMSHGRQERGAGGGRGNLMRTPGTPVTVSNSDTSGRSTPHSQGSEQSFKQRKTFNSRKRDVEEITKKHPHKVPIVIEKSKTEKHLPLLDKSKFLVPEELTMSQLTTIIRRRLQLSDTQAFYLVVNRRTMVSASMTLAEVYRTDKDSDGFLYITYASQEMFG